MFTVSVSNGKETRMMDCNSDEKLKFCFLIENVQFVPFDRSCRTREVEATYIANYGDGSTDVVSQNTEFCHYFSDGNFKISVTSIPKIKGCEHLTPFTAPFFIGVVECPLPIVRYMTNTCCLESWCEAEIGTGCDIHIEATDIYNQPMTYCWDMSRNGKKFLKDASQIIQGPLPSHRLAGMR